MTGPPGYRVAIIGFGPRGFGCLERLGIEVAKRGPSQSRLVVTVHDPQPHPGAGPPYNPDQPECMLLNFGARHIDIWSDDNPLLPPDQRPDFLEWLRHNHGEWASGDAFVPRRLLGCYLRDCLASLIAALPTDLHFRQVPGEVIDLEFRDGRWSVRHLDPALDVEGVEEVMVATGHGMWRQGAGNGLQDLGLPAAPNTRYIPSVYPVGERLSQAAVPHGAVVGIRGFALTALDAALALTEGRGGSFQTEASGIPRYRGPGIALVPFSRSGLPPLAKPEAALARRSGDLTDVWDPLRQGILDADRLTPGGLLQRLHRAGMRAIIRLGGQVSPVPSGRAGLGSPGPLQVMERSVQVASGLLPPDVPWARGEAWRRAYPSVVRRASEGGLAATFPDDFARLACTMERYAFGPPASSLARIVSLASAGHLELRALRAPEVRSQGGRLVLQRDGSPIALDVLVNAVTPPPGVHGHQPLLLDLVRRGHASRARGWDGVVVSPSAASIGVNGSPTPGLSIVGRATEGWTLGNDTLNRTLHDHTRRWARRVTAKAHVHDPTTRRLGVGTPR